MILSHWLAALALVGGPLQALAAKHHDFKECHQQSFCRRLRGIAERADNTGFRSPYTLDAPITTKGKDAASWTFPLHTSLYEDIQFELQLDFLQKGDGIARVRVDEVGSKLPWKRYDEAAKWALVESEPTLVSMKNVTQKTSKNGKLTTFTYGPELSLSLEFQHDPFHITFKQGQETVMTINDRNLFHMEHFREKESKQEVIEGGEGDAQVVLGSAEKKDTTWFEGEPDKEMFQETWSKWTDSKPKGPEGFAVDISFPGAEHVYGLAEHASPLSLRSTDGSGEGAFKEPYRLYNVDIFEYEADSPMSMYGNIPMIHAQTSKHSVGVLNLVGSETLVDVKHPKSGVQTHWISESGIMDLFILPGPKPNDLFSQYASLTGTAPVPPLWSIAYHQCRWNYLDQVDVLEVNRRFDEDDIPLDVTWLDIEYAAEHKYFDWDKKQFPDPVKMQEEIGAMGRKMVAIVDPHIKKADTFRVYKDAVEKDIITKRNDNSSNFEGWCWTGSSVWVDFFNPKSWSWWTDMFSFKVWEDSTKFLYIWNDMNEPSVFDGPEISMPRDNIHDGGWEHRDVHNINGMTFQRATYDALVERESPKKRPFVLSRSFFPGSQRYGAIWTGDNMGTWEHMAGQTAMLLSLNVCGMTFSGADVGGFFGNPSVEMLIRWYQAGAFMPFFRAHAHIDTKRREPFLFDEPYKGIMRDIIQLRYQMLSVWYTAFYEASVSGIPTMRPQYAVFPTDQSGFAIDDQYYVGSSGLLVKPVTTAGAEEALVYLSDNQPYYNYFSHRVYPASKRSRHVKVPAPLESFPVLLQGGSILPIRTRARRASTLMWRDPFTLIIAVGVDGTASGKLYLDDGDSFDYEQGLFVLREFKLTASGKRFTLSNHDLRSSGQSETQVAAYSPSRGPWAEGIAGVKIEQIIVLGLKSKPSSVTVGGTELEWFWEAGAAASTSSEGTASKLTVKNPAVKVVEDWSIIF